MTWRVAALAGLTLVGCAPAFRYAGPAGVRPIADAPQELIVDGLRHADLVVLGTPDTLTAEQMLAAGIQFGYRDAWWNARVTFEAVAKGNPRHARMMDYGTLPAWMTPPKPFRLAKNQIMVQLASRWQSAPVVLGERAVYFFKKCYNCVQMPGRTDKTTKASPWFAVLTLTPDHWPAVLDAWNTRPDAVRDPAPHPLPYSAAGRFPFAY